MQYITVFLILLTFASMLVILTKKRIEEVMPISVVEIVLMIFLAGLFDQLEIGVIIVGILTVVQLIIMLVMALKYQSEIKGIIKNILTPGFVIFSALFMFSAVINHGRILENYDEFTHWGLITKNMFMYNSFGTNPESVVRFVEYPPFTAIFQYLFLAIQKVYTEDTIIIAHNILYLSIAISFTKNISWKKKDIVKMIGIIPIIIFIPMIFYQNFFLEILVDGMLGIMFAYVMISAVQKEENIQFKYLKIFAGITMLCLTKTTGIALAVIAVIAIIIKNIINIKNKKDKSKIELKTIVIVTLITAIFTSLYYIKISGVETKWNYNEFIQTSEITEEQKEQIAQNYITQLFNGEKITEKNLTTIGILTVLICVHVLLIKSKDNKSGVYFDVAMIFSIVIYLIGTLIVYTTIFDLSEALTLTSFQRYISTILLAYMIFGIYRASQLKKLERNKIFLIVIVACVLLLPISNIERKYVDGKNYKTSAKINKDFYTKIRYKKDQLKPTDKILFITESTDKTKLLVALNEYEIMPIKLSGAIVANFDEESEFEEIAKKYTHIFIYHIEDKEKEIIKNKFDSQIVQENAIYKVINQNNEIMLERM